MATEANPKPLTAEEFMKLDLDEGLHELVRGEIVAYPVPMLPHGFVCGRLVLALGTYCLGEHDLIENLPELPGFACRVADFFA